MLASVSFSVFTDYTKNELMGWQSSGVTCTRTRIRVIGVNFSEFLIKGNGISFKLAGNLS